VHTYRDLEGLVRKIARADKMAESRELASTIQKNLYGGARQLFPSTKNRGVRSAPFVVLIGAKMPSVLAEVAFLSNPRDERLLKKESTRQRLARALFLGIEVYMKALGSEVAQTPSNSAP
jgi:N-acetylmuramoyl-L-alanine amidase